MKTTIVVHFIQPSPNSLPSMNRLELWRCSSYIRTTEPKFNFRPEPGSQRRRLEARDPSPE
jgi:hypothetical protein